MDVNDLAECEVNVVQWINDNFKKYTEEVKAHNADENKKNNVDDYETALEFINSYMVKLQVHVKQVNYALEDNSHKVLLNMPRIVKESQSLRMGVEQLRQRVLDIHREVANVHEETGTCMSKLERLNTIQMELRNAKESLQESDGWGNLIATLEDCFERSDFKDMCDKIVALQKSLVAQEQLPGHVERQSQVDDFKNRLEALVSPSVVQCFAGGDKFEAQRYVSMFAAIQRSPQLLQYYRAVQKTSLQQRWKQVLDFHNNTAQQTRFLSVFYDELLENCRQQVKWCIQVFKTLDGQEQPFLVLAELLPSLQPTRDQSILQLFKTCSDRLGLLLQFARDNEIFVAQINAFFVQQPTIKLSQELQRLLARRIFEFFHKFIEQYPRLEETSLSAQTDQALEIQTNAGDAVRHLRDITNKMFTWLAEALTRCSNISGDIALCKLIKLLSSVFKPLLEQFSRTQRQLTLNVGAGFTFGAHAPNESDWSLLQQTLSLLECLADFQQRLRKFEEILYERVRILKEQLLAIKQSTVINFYQTLEVIEQQNLLRAIDELQQKRLETSQDSEANFLGMGIFTDIYNSLKTLFTETHDIALNILLKPLEVHMSCIDPTRLSGLGQNHMHEHMPMIGYAPQECITQIGQYLLTLPQHLEPLLLTPSPLLKLALKMSNIKYSQPIPSVNVLLNLVAAQCCTLYQTQILQMKSLSSIAARQLAVDIDYLSSVLEELGLNLSTGLSQTLILLKASPENYVTLSVGCEPRLVSAVRQIRNINIIAKE